MVNQRFESQVAIIAGASGGIGQAVARRLASEGAAVALLARRRERLQQVADEIRDTGGKALPLPCEATDPAAVTAALATLSAEWGTPHILVNCIGQELVAPFTAFREEDLQRMTDANLRGLWGLTREVGKSMLRQKRGSIVTIASITGQVGVPAMSIYGAFKGAVLSWSRSLAMEWAPYGIRVNAVACGLVKTEMFTRITSRLKSEEVDRIEKQYPLGLGAAEDVAAAVSFLASADARWMTGTTLTLDGGYSAR